MNAEKFLELEYQTLRDEIRDTKARITRILVFGVTVVPAAQFLANTYNIDILIVSMPLLVLVISFLYLSENHALMRCGRYILFEIESRIEGVTGWEKWLTTPDEYGKRSPDRFVAFSFHLLFFIYFAVSVFLACGFARQNYGYLWAGLILGFYAVVGLWSAVYFFQNIRVSTTTKGDDA